MDKQKREEVEKNIGIKWQGLSKWSWEFSQVFFGNFNIKAAVHSIIESFLNPKSFCTFLNESYNYWFLFSKSSCSCLKTGSCLVSRCLVIECPGVFWNIDAQCLGLSMASRFLALHKFIRFHLVYMILPHVLLHLIMSSNLHSLIISFLTLSPLILCISVASILMWREL